MNPVQFGLQFRNDVMRTHVYEPSQRNQPGLNLHYAVEALREPLQEADPEEKVEIRFHTNVATNPYVVYSLRRADSQDGTTERDVSGERLRPEERPQLVSELWRQIQNIAENRPQDD